MTTFKVIQPHWLKIGPTTNWEPKARPADDSAGVERGARGFAKLDKTDRQFLEPDFDRKRQVGQRAVGMFATADNPGVVNLEGDDV